MIASQVFSGFAFDGAGTGINGATVELFPRNTTSTATTSTTTNSDGYWTMSTSTEGRFDVRITSGSSIRYLKYDDEVQMTTLEVANLSIRNPADTFDYAITPAAIVADRTLTLPLMTGSATLIATPSVEDLDMGGFDVDNAGFVILNAATAPAGSEVYLVNDNTGDLTLNALSGKSINFAIAGTNEMEVAAANFQPSTNDGLILGGSSRGWSDLFLAVGAVVNFGAGDVTLTHSTAKVTWGGDGAVEIDFNNHEMTNVDINSGTFIGTIDGASTVTADLTFNDSVNLTFGTGGDVDLDYDGTDLVLNLTVVGSGDLVVNGGSIEFDDSEGVTLGTGKDATLQYDGTDLVLSPAAVGSGDLVISGASAEFGDAEGTRFGAGKDAEIRWSTGDADNHALVVGIGDSNQGLHITDLGAIATDWNIAATTHPTVYIHSNTTPATDYLRLGDHDGTSANVDVVGGTTLALKIAGTNAATLTATTFTVINDGILRVGTDGDGVVAHTAAGVGANTALTNALVGTPVTTATTANSMIVSTITASSDILIATNRSGNSEERIFIDATGGLSLRSVAGANVTLDSSTGHILMNAASRLFFDGGDGTYIVESSNDILDFYVGDQLMMRFTEAGTDTIQVTAASIDFQNAAAITTTTGDLTLNPAGNLTVNNGDLLLKSTDGGATGPIIQLYHDTASASATGGQDEGDRLGVIDFLNTDGTIFGEISVALEGSAAQAGMHFRLKGDATNDKLYINRDGNATLLGTLTESSDERFKENVATLTSSLAKVTQMRGVSFTRKDFTDKTQKHVGLIAQELESIAPELVATGSDGFKSVAYSQLVAYLIEAAKELKAEIDELKSRE